jgi:hypothetical protein
MYTTAEIALLRESDPGAVIPGIDTPVGNPLPQGSLIPLGSISTNEQAPIHYSAATNSVYVDQAGAVLSGYNFGSAAVLIGADNVSIEDSTFNAPNGWYCIRQMGNYTGATVENNSFTGASATDLLELTDFVYDEGTGTISVVDNSFVDTPSDAINISSWKHIEQLLLWCGVFSPGQPSRRDLDS